MVNLDKKVFGDITLKEVIGANPPLEKFQKLLENQFQILQNEINSMNKQKLQTIMNNQIKLERETNSRPGSMALAQDKIQLLVDYSQQYISQIKSKL